MVLQHYLDTLQTGMDDVTETGGPVPPELYRPAKLLEDLTQLVSNGCSEETDLSVWYPRVETKISSILEEGQKTRQAVIKNMIDNPSLPDEIIGKRCAVLRLMTRFRV